MTILEEEMFALGYVSSRMAAYKLMKDFKSVLRQVSRGQFRAKRVGKQQQFIEIKSILEWYDVAEGEEDPERDPLRLNDWADIFRVDEKEQLHVRRR